MKNLVYLSKKEKYADTCEQPYYVKLRISI